MAVLYITEFDKLSNDTRSPVPVAGKPIATQTVTIGGASAASAAFNAATRFVRLHTDAICSIEFGTAPVAEATNERMSADQTEYRGVTAGEKVAVITNT